MKLKIPYSIRKSLIKILPFVATAIMSTACHKEPYDVVIDWDWSNPPDQESVKQYATDPATRTVILNLLPCKSGLSFCPLAFNRGFNYLEQHYFSIDPDKIIGSGTIFVDEIGGAHLSDPNDEDNFGMSLYDSIRYTSKGFNIARGRPPANSR